MAVTTTGYTASLPGQGTAGNLTITIPGANAPVNSIVIIDWAWTYNDGSPYPHIEMGTFRIGGTGVAINISVKDSAIGDTLTWTSLAMNIT
jgi:hypothetical protein